MLKRTCKRCGAPVTPYVLEQDWMGMAAGTKTWVRAEPLPSKGLTIGESNCDFVEASLRATQHGRADWLHLVLPTDMELRALTRDLVEIEAGLR